MKWYYVENSQQAGPVEETAFPELIASGKLRPETLVWCEGMPEWRPFATACPGSIPPVTSFTPSGNDAACSECGGIFNKNDMITHGSRYICARCKPVFMQKLAEGGSGPRFQAAGMLSPEEIMARDYDFDFGGYLNKSWELFKANAGGMIGVSLLVYLALIAINIIPYANILLGFFFTGPLMSGLWMYYLKCLRGETPQVGDGFSGFGPRYWQLVLVQFIPALISLGVMMGFGILVGLGVPAAVSISGSGGGSSSAATFSVWLVPLGILVLIVGLIMVYLNVCWLFALPLVADKGLQFWPAMQLSRRVVSRHWWGTLGLLVVGSIIGMLGAFACLVGVLVTAPVAFTMWICHYQRVFGELAAQP